jgi:predicted CXXCH cytochrome family protein
MKNNMKLIRGLTGALSVSALTLGFAGVAHAALMNPTSGPASGVQGALHYDGAIVDPSLLPGSNPSTVVYNSGFGGNGAGISGVGTGATTMGGAAGPFAPASSINITYSRHNLGSSNKIDSNHTFSVLASNNKGQDNAVVGTNQICVFCHTPHGFNTVQSGPMWNKQVSASTAYTVYNAGTNNSDTLDAAAPVIGSVSLACLSCHDGTQAMDNMINAPGSGGMAQIYDASLNASSGVGGNAGISPTASSVQGGANSTGISQGYIWGDSAGGFAFMSQGGSGYASSNGDNPAQEGIDIGTDLSNDHPISVQYCGGGITSTGASAISTKGQIAEGTCNDRLFNLPTVQTLNGQSRFWVDTNVIPDQDAIDAGAASTGGSTANPITRDPETIEAYVTNGTGLASGNILAYSTTNIASAVAAGSCGTGAAGDNCGRGFIPLVKGAFNATTGVTTVASNNVAGFGVRTKQDIILFTNNAGVSGPSVECASCHDAHTPNNGTFLRVSNNGSGLCLSCHVK